MSPEEAEKKSARKTDAEPQRTQRGAKEKPAETKKEVPAGGGPEDKKDEKPGPGKPLTKKARPTNCAFTNARIRRKDWYYRNGMYFANKNAFKEYMKKEREESAKKKGDAPQAAGEAEAKKAAAPPPRHAAQGSGEPRSGPSEAPKKSEAPAKETGGT